MEQLPLDLVYCNILPCCNIDIRVSFKIPPKKIDKSNYNIPIRNINRDQFEIIAMSHLQTIKSLYNWVSKLDHLFKFFNISPVDEEFLVMKLIFIPQYKIIYGDTWRSRITLLSGVDIDYIHFLDEPDISIYESLYPYNCHKYPKRHCNKI